MLENHFTISLHYLSVYSEPQICVCSLCNRDTKDVTKWVPNLWNYPHGNYLHKGYHHLIYQVPISLLGMEW